MRHFLPPSRHDDHPLLGTQTEALRDLTQLGKTAARCIPVITCFFARMEQTSPRLQ